MLNQPWLPVERCKLAVSSLLRCEGWVVVIKNARYEANSYTKYVNRWWKSVSSPTRVASWRIALECCRLLLIRTWQVIGGIRIVSAFKSKLSRHKESWVHPWELRKKKKCLLGWFHSECFMFLKKEALFINVEKKFVWVFKVCENIKCTFFFFPHTSFLHFLTEKSSEAHITLSQYLQLRSGCCFRRSRAMLCLF